MLSRFSFAMLQRTRLQPVRVMGAVNRMSYMQQLGMDEDAVVARAQSGADK